MERDDQLLLAAFTRTDAGFSPGEFDRVRHLVERGYCSAFSEAGRWFLNITAEGHARVAAVVNTLLHEE